MAMAIAQVDTRTSLKNSRFASLAAICLSRALF